MAIIGTSATAYLSDNETKVDLLNNEAIATTIVKLLRERPDRPVVIGVHGDWGAGKSSMLEMIETGLDGEEDVLCLKFNGWRFQGFEDAKISLLEGIVTGLLEKRPALTKATDKVKAVFSRIDLLKVAKKAGGLALTAFTGIPSPDQIHAVVKTIEGLFADPSKLVTKENVDEALDGARSLLKPESESRNVPEEIDKFRKAFDDLLKEAKVGQLVVLIDDLDRCLPDSAIETLEAVRLFVFTSRTAFVVAADETMIEYAVRKHFPDLPDTSGPQTYARNYLEKLIQIPFRIPALGETESRIYITLLLVGAELGENDADFGKMITIARERLKRPWEGGILDIATVRAAIGDKTPIVQYALTFSDQIGPILASGTRGNPRQIKRFLNSLVLRQRSAEARGFGSEVRIPILAKLMLAERFMPRLFDQVATIAATAPDGICVDLALLEAAALEKNTSSKKKLETINNGMNMTKREVTKRIESILLDEWLSSQAILSWAAVQPLLTGVDLRPYLFVTKDRKDYFGAASVLGHLSTVVEQLLGPKFTVQAIESDLKRLALPEAAQVFEAVRGRIIGGGSFDKTPAGVDGLTILVKAHPTLQTNLLDFLESLPMDVLGPWVVKGWESAIKADEQVIRFDKLLQNWAASTNSVLKTTAAGALKMRKGGR